MFVIKWSYNKNAHNTLNYNILITNYNKRDFITKLNIMINRFETIFLENTLEIVWLL